MRKSRPTSRMISRGSTPYRTNRTNTVCYAPRNTQGNKVVVPKKSRPTPIPTKQTTPIPSYLDRSRVQQSRGQSRNSNKSNFLEDPELISLREQLLDGDSFDEIEEQTLQNLLIHLREYYTDMVGKREYESAKDAQGLSEAIRDELKLRKDSGSGYSERGAPYETVKSNQEEKNRQELQDFDDKWAQKEAELNVKQREELEAFETRWQDEYPRKYRKQSAKLIQLHEMEKKLGVTDDLDQAMTLRSEVDALEREELEKAQESLIRDYDLARAKLDADQRTERDNFTNTRDHYREIMLAKHKMQMEAVQNREKVLTTKKETHVKHRESSFDIMNQAPPATSTAAQKRRENSEKGKDHLLPPLIPPNDQRIKDRKQKAKADQKQRNERFKEHREQKRREAEEDAQASEKTEAKNVPEAFKEMVEQINIPEDLPHEAE